MCVRILMVLFMLNHITADKFQGIALIFTVNSSFRLGGVMLENTLCKFCSILLGVVFVSSH